MLIILRDQGVVRAQVLGQVTGATADRVRGITTGGTMPFTSGPAGDALRTVRLYRTEHLQSSDGREQTRGHTVYP